MNIEQLLEALDWKLMHESDLLTIQRTISEMVIDASNDINLLPYPKLTPRADFPVQFKAATKWLNILVDADAGLADCLSPDAIECLLNFLEEIDNRKDLDIAIQVLVREEDVDAPSLWSCVDAGES
nr:PREDICTED: uncharacterized protein LOC108216296 isoform X2 [Daucus carota subsp. sativus]XP_017244509.1 PREDICTED: uncharacterized protein LOC108216296 isoform X2 [Daucus carota subsp. sativus]XP_017244510.1 PREDICTED: uncharacterized protein LOC108216296 isoform X2 [Daucus carota subsp. sativus]